LPLLSHIVLNVKRMIEGDSDDDNVQHLDYESTAKVSESNKNNSGNISKTLSSKSLFHHRKYKGDVS
jgi:hypothetical protein